MTLKVIGENKNPALILKNATEIEKSRHDLGKVLGVIEKNHHENINKVS